MKKRFLIPSLLAAGMIPMQAIASIYNSSGQDTNDGKTKWSLFKIFKLEHKYTLAGHRSHASHSSHGSHRSSSGGGYSAPRAPATARPTPLYTPPTVRSNSTAPASILPQSPATAPKTLPGNTDKFREIAMRVQTALSLYGYYTGKIDGAIGPESKAALSKFQSEWGLPVTGTITPEVLDAMLIKAE